MHTVLIHLKIARSSREIRVTWLTVWYDWRPVPMTTSNALVVRGADREGPLARGAGERGRPTSVNVYHQLETTRCLTVLKCAAAPSTCSRYLVFRSGGPISSRRAFGISRREWEYVPTARMYCSYSGQLTRRTQEHQTSCGIVVRSRAGLAAFGSSQGGRSDAHHRQTARLKAYPGPRSLADLSRSCRIQMEPSRH